MKKKLALLLTLSTLICILFTGCGSNNSSKDSEKANRSVNLNDYVVITTEGANGYGTISVEVDFNKLINDYKDKLTDEGLDSSVFGDKTPELAAAYLFQNLDPFVLVYEQPEGLKNGDKIEFSWNKNEEGIKALREILKVKISCSKFTHKVSGLKALKKVDPFENVEFSHNGFSGNGGILTATAMIDVDGKEKLSLSLTVDKSKNGTLCNGDTVSLSLDDSKNKNSYAESHGITFTRLSADVKVEILRYYPTQNPKEVFEHISEQDHQNLIAAVKDKYSSYAGNIEVKYVGALYNYTDPIDFTKTNFYDNNELAFIFHVTNGIEPDGWYTYMSPTDPTYIKVTKNEDGKLEKHTVMANGSMLYFDQFPTSQYNYNTDKKRISKTDGPATYFTYKDLYYEGHQTIEQCINAYNYYRITNCYNYINKKVDRGFNHVVATDSLSEYVTER